jgi:3-deoxy-7-phosphoheptulonate synthase
VLLGAIGAVTDFDPRNTELIEGVSEVVRITLPYKLASHAFRPDGSIIELGNGVRIGGTGLVMAASPCAVESPDQIEELTEQVIRSGAKLLRGGAFKPRTSPYSFQGLGEKGLKLLRIVADRHGLLVVSEVMDPSQVPMVIDYVDLLQVGT